MKKTLLLLASAAMLLVGCAKEKLGPDAGSGEMVTANFTAQMQGMPQTKAVTDGEGTKATRCVMEIYYQGVLYTREVKLISEMEATFTPKLVSNRTYDVLFWADCGEGLADKYYTTNAEGGLQAVEMKTTAYAANDDARDAFYITKSVPVGQQVSSETFTLTRPFSQVNIITTDATIIKNANLYPDGVKMVYTAPTKFNLLTETLSEEKELTITGAPYETFDKTSAALTLEMDYLFTGKDKSALDIAFEASKVGELTVTSHSFTNIPVQRNYRTNIKGALLTTTGDWTATIAPAWTTPAYDVPFYVATSIQDAQEYIGTSSEQVKSKAVDLSKAAITQGDVESDGTIHFILKTTSPKDLVNFTLPAIPETIQGCEGWTIKYEPQYPTENVGVNAPEGTKVKILAPTSHVNVTGTTYAQIEALTGDETLVIPQGVTVDSLIIKKGAVEIHGIVTNLTVDPAPIAYTDPVQHEKVVFRECEGLSASVFEKIYNESEHINYIDPMYAYVQVDGKYNIYKLPVVAMIGTVEYPSLAAAIAAVPANNTQLVTINVMSDVVLKKADALDINALDINKNNVVIDGQYHTIALDENDPELAQYLADGTNGTYGNFQMIKVSGNDVTLKNLTLDCKNYRGASLATTNGGKNASYENIVYKGLGSGHYYGTAGTDGTLTFKNCTFETHGYAIHTAECKSVLEVSDCEIHGWVSYGDKTKSATFTNTHFYSTEDAKNGVLATIRPYCATTITNCTFSKEYLIKYKFDGLTVRSNVVVSLKDCSVEEGELCDIANITCPDDPWIDGGVIAIDATGNATDGFTAGTFVAKQASDIKVAGLNEAVPVEGKDNVYTIAPKTFPENIVAVCNGNEYETIEAALDAAYQAKGGEITLVKDVTLAKSQDFNYNTGARELYNFVLNLNGKTIYRGTSNYSLSLVNNHFTVIDEIGGGTVNKGTDGYSSLYMGTAQEHEKQMLNIAKFETCPLLILNGGTYEAPGDLNNFFSRKIGLNISAGATGDGYMSVCKFVINDGNIRNLKILNSQGEISGGTFKGQILIDIDENTFEKVGIVKSDFLTTISGGTFTLDSDKPIIFDGASLGHYADLSNLQIKGGTFNFNPSVSYSACIPAGYTSQDNGDGTWTVVAEN